MLRQFTSLWDMVTMGTGPIKVLLHYYYYYYYHYHLPNKITVKDIPKHANLISSWLPLITGPPSVFANNRPFGPKVAGKDRAHLTLILDILYFSNVTFPFLFFLVLCFPFLMCSLYSIHPWLVQLIKSINSVMRLKYQGWDWVTVQKAESCPNSRGVWGHAPLENCEI